LLNRSNQNKTVSLKEDALEAALLSCPWCNSNSTEKRIQIQLAPKIEFRQCNSCHIGFANRQPTSSFLNDYYQGYYDGKKQHVNADASRFAKRILGQRSYNDSVTILDFGGGDGSVAIAIAKLLIAKQPKPVTITVVDPNYIATTQPNHLIAVSSVTDLSMAQKSFDFVLALGLGLELELELGLVRDFLS